tara:strand:+ start:358 stop:828 length:471 start_codon:yes stop_codon:yes gene_type:complete
MNKVKAKVKDPTEEAIKNISDPDSQVTAESLAKVINFINAGAVSYLCSDLWELIDDYDLTVWDFHNKTDGWKQAVADSVCEDYWGHDYETIWPKIVATSYRVKREQCAMAHEVAVATAEKIKEQLISEAIDATLDLDFTNLNFDNVVNEVSRKYTK